MMETVAISKRLTMPASDRLHHLGLGGDVLFHDFVRFLKRLLGIQGIASEIKPRDFTVPWLVLEGRRRRLRLLCLEDV